MELKYGCNPQQGNARLLVGSDPSPLKVLNGRPGYINLMDLCAAWQLARELKQSTGKPAAASFKHVSPAGAAIAHPLDDQFLQSQMLPGDDYSGIATAYIRARAGDRLASFGDVAAVSDPVDRSLASVLKREVSDAIIAPGYDPDALEILKSKKKGAYLVMEIDPEYEPPIQETRDLFGFKLVQDRNSSPITTEHFKNVVSEGKEVPVDILETMKVAMITLKYTQSNSVCVAYEGQAIGIGAGQQSRIHCTRLACSKAEKWLMQFHPHVLQFPFKEGLSRTERTNFIDQYLLWDEIPDPERCNLEAAISGKVRPITDDENQAWIRKHDGLVISSDAFFPFRDNIDRARQSNIQYIVQPGGSTRDDIVLDAVNEHRMVMIHTGLRLFLH
jgi:phosphoribosylaminoimidazolecarboxamide formyltransferase/IMP cyclohydrolase